MRSKGLIASGVTRERFAMLGMEYKHISRFLYNDNRLFRYGCINFEEISFTLRSDRKPGFRGMVRRGIEVFPVSEGNIQSAIEIVDTHLMR